MKVRELIEQLQKHNPELPVRVSTVDCGCISGWQSVSFVKEGDVLEYDYQQRDYVKIKSVVLVDIDEGE